MLEAEGCSEMTGPNDSPRQPPSVQPLFVKGA